MASLESRPRKAVNLRQPFFRTVLTAMVTASIVVMMQNFIIQMPDPQFLSTLEQSQVDARRDVTNVRHDLDSLRATMDRHIREMSGQIREMSGQILDFKTELRSVENTIGSTRETQQTSDRGLVEFLPLVETSNNATLVDDTRFYHYFLSIYKTQGFKEGPPEIFIYPSTHDPISRGRLLCIRGNDTFDGSQNHYAFAYTDTLPASASLVPGTTLISDSTYDFVNPWHSMFNLFQFFLWKIQSKTSSGQCPHVSHLLLFHRGEYRTNVGPWISNLLKAFSFPTSVLPLNSNDPVCFEQAVVSRRGIASMERPLRRRMYDEARCQAQASCHVVVPQRVNSSLPQVRITLVVRTGGRSFKNEEAWKRVVKQQCEKAKDCIWSTMHVANLNFCEQVKVMSYTDILVSAHGAQLTNMFFMPPGGSVMEIFPAGWLELAGVGQYIYRTLAHSVGLSHEGYWRDPTTPPCPYPNVSRECFRHYKDQPIGINETYIADWLSKTISKFRNTSLLSSSPILHQTKTTCECANKPMNHTSSF